MCFVGTSTVVSHFNYTVYHTFLGFKKKKILLQYSMRNVGGKFIFSQFIHDYSHNNKREECVCNLWDILGVKPPSWWN